GGAWGRSVQADVRGARPGPGAPSATAPRTPSPRGGPVRGAPCKLNWVARHVAGRHSREVGTAPPTSFRGPSGCGSEEHQMPKSPATRLHHSIPAEVRALPRWVCWVSVPPSVAGQKPGKKPINPRTGAGASSTNPDDWTTFDEALAAMKQRGDAGLMFAMVPEDGFVFI